MKRGGLLIPAILVAFFVVGYVLGPLWSLLRSSLLVSGSYSLERYAAVLDFSDPANREAIVNSLAVSAVSVVFAGVIGFLLAFVFTQFDFPLRRLFSRLAVLPVALPPLVGVVAFLFVFGESGILPRFGAAMTGLRPAALSLEGIPAIVAVHVYSFYVYFYLLVSAALRRLDGSSIDAASVLGSSPWRTFWRIILPQLRSALAGGTILTFMASMASFSAPLLFAGARRFLTLQIYSMKLNGDLDLAAAQSIVLTLISLVFFVGLAVLLARGGGAVGSKGAPRTALVRVSSPLRKTLIGASACFVVVGMLPLLVIGLLSFAREGSWTWQLLPSSYTLENYAVLFREPNAFTPLVNSLTMAFLAAVAAAIVGVAGALLVNAQKQRGRQVALDGLLTLPYAVPGTVVALALILAFSAPSFLTAGQPLVGTFWILPLAYLVRTYPFVQRSASSALAQLDPSIPEAGEMLGAGPWRRWRRLVLPLILPGVLAGTLLVAITAVGEFVSSILLYTYSSRPVSVEILAQLRNFNFGAAAAYSVLLLAVILTLVGASGRLSERADLPGT
jgi:iron(III) transport system permease protein